MAKLNSKRYAKLDSGLIVPYWHSPRTPLAQRGVTADVVQFGASNTVLFTADGKVSFGCNPGLTCALCSGPSPQTIKVVLGAVPSAGTYYPELTGVSYNCGPPNWPLCNCCWTYGVNQLVVGLNASPYIVVMDIMDGVQFLLNPSNKNCAEWSNLNIPVYGNYGIGTCHITAQ